MFYPEPVPPGFTLHISDRHRLVIHYRWSGMGALTAFLVVWLSGWSLGCVALLHAYLNPGPGDPVPLAVLMSFWTAEIIVFGLLVYLHISRKTFTLDAQSLTIHTQLWRWQWQRVIHKHQIAELIQVQDGGKGRDSFPSWGLHLVGFSKARLKLVSRQPYEKSAWLGQVIAQWAGAPYLPAPPPRF